jgi:hypothetical protein
LGQVNNTEELNRVESELKKLREDKIRGIIMRTKAKWNVEGERSSKDHFPFCPFLFFERRVRNSSTTNY